MNKNFYYGSAECRKKYLLGALWNSVNQKEIHTELTLKKMVGDSQYLYRLEQKWLEVERLERTVIGQEKRNYQFY